MEHHPLLSELLQLCSIHNLDKTKAYSTYEAFTELSEVRKLWTVEHHYNDKMKIFYLTAKKEKLDKEPDIFIPVMFDCCISPEEMDSIHNHICQSKKEFYLLIRDRDSSSTCYKITRDLVKPDSPATCTSKKELESKQYQQEKIIQNNRKVLFAKALKTLHDGS